MENVGRVSTAPVFGKSKTTSKIKTIPEITRPVARVFTTCQFSKYDVAKLLVRVNVPNAEPKVRKIQPMELYSNYIHEIYRETVGAKE